MPYQTTPIQSNAFTVTVSVNTAGNALVFNPDPVQLTPVSNALIVYSLVTPGYHFPVDGSALVISGDDEGEEFPTAWYVNASMLALSDRNDNATSYKYTMTVINTQTGAKISTDPTIVNDPEK